MAVPPELVWLIERLRTTPSKSGRLRLLLGAMSTVRSLGPADRLAVARELGFDGAERLVEEMAERRGFDAGPWVAMLDEAEHSGSGGAEEVIRGLADPARRKQTLGRLLDRAVEKLAGPASPPPAADPGEPAEPSDAGPDSVETGTPEGLRSPPAVQPEEAPPATPAGRPAAVPPHGRRGEPVEPEPRKVPADVARPPAAAPLPQGRDWPARPVASSMPAPAALPTARGGSLAEELASEPRLLARLRLLTDGLSRLRGADVEELEAVLEAFPDGWSRRRALERLVEVGLPASAADAAALIALLDRPSDRIWTIRTLAAERALDDRDRSALLAAAGSPEAARRLIRALARR